MRRLRGRRLSVVFCLAALCALPSGLLTAAAEPPAPPAAPDRARFLVRAEQELMRGDTAAALDDFERAAMMRHEADAELGLIRAAVQSGQYRRALAFCAHTAGEHRDEPVAGALYAWLLRIGGQRVLGERVLAETVARAPAEPVLNAVVRAFAADPPVAQGTLLDPPHRLAPWPTMRDGQPPVPGTARLASGGVLVGTGAFAVVPVVSLPRVAGARIWVRNGLGETTEAARTRPDPTLDDAGVAVLTLKSALGPPALDDPTEPAEPFAGSPGAVVQFAETAEPQWPWLRQGFFGRVEASTGLRRLGFDARGAPGAAVLDTKGRLVGMTMPDAAAGDTRWLSATRWKSLSMAAADAPNTAVLLGAAVASPSPSPSLSPSSSQTLPAPGFAAPDALYEAGLRRALQVLVDFPTPTP